MNSDLPKWAIDLRDAEIAVEQAKQLRATADTAIGAAYAKLDRARAAAAEAHERTMHAAYAGTNRERVRGL